MSHGPEYVTLGQALKRLRHAAGLTQTDAAARIGVSPQSVSTVECAERGLRWHHLVRYLAVYGVDLSVLATEIQRIEAI
jgi:transcriptional regulator with XRE-family HTH domain